MAFPAAFITPKPAPEGAADPDGERNGPAAQRVDVGADLVADHGELRERRSEDATLQGGVAGEDGGEHGGERE